CSKGDHEIYLPDGRRIRIRRVFRQSTGGRRGERRDRHGGNAETGALVQSVGDGFPSAAETFGCRLSGEDFQSRKGAAIRRPPDAGQLSRLARGRESTQASWKDHSGV